MDKQIVKELKPNPNFITTNIRYKINGYTFDAAVDICWQLHSYANYMNLKDVQDCTAIEIYNLDKPEWDIKMIYQKNSKNIIDFSKIRQQYEVIRTFVDFNNIIEETKKWIKENT